MVEGVSEWRSRAGWSSSMVLYDHRDDFSTEIYVHRGTLSRNPTRDQISGFQVKIATRREHSHMVSQYEAERSLRGECDT